MTVVKSSAPALAEPKFIIKLGEKYFITLALWEYDLSKAQGEDQKEGCRDTQKLFENGKKIDAVLIPSGRASDKGTGTRTGPQLEGDATRP
ncbi:MAG: hypothetical protein ACR2F8_00710 [Caulobacteraceae bacterium]